MEIIVDLSARLFPGRRLVGMTAPFMGPLVGNEGLSCVTSAPSKSEQRAVGGTEHVC